VSLRMAGSVPCVGKQALLQGWLCVRFYVPCKCACFCGGYFFKIRIVNTVPNTTSPQTTKRIVFISFSSFACCSSLFGKSIADIVLFKFSVVAINSLCGLRMESVAEITFCKCSLNSVLVVLAAFTAACAAALAASICSTAVLNCAICPSIFLKLFG
jgi:hypothetical protein